MVDAGGFEPPAPGLQTRCSTQLSYAPRESADRAGVLEFDRRKVSLSYRFEEKSIVRRVKWKLLL